MMRYFFVLLVFLFFEQAMIAQDTLFTKSIVGAGALNLSVSSPILFQNKIILLASNYQDSVANPDFKMIVMDTCGNVEKIHTIPLGYGDHGLQFDGFFFPDKNVFNTSDGNIFILANQRNNFIKDSPHCLAIKLDINGKILEKEVIYTNIPFFCTKMFETSDAFYLTGYAHLDTPVPPTGFLMKLDKKLKPKWKTLDFIGSDITQVGDTIGIIGSWGMIKIFNNDTKAVRYQLADFDYFTQSTFIEGFNAACFYDIYLKDSLGNTYSRTKMVRTDNNFKIKSEKILEDALAIRPLYDKKDNSFILDVFDLKSKLVLPIGLGKMDSNGNFIWIRTDSIVRSYSTKNLKPIYDTFSGYLLLPSKNIIGIVYAYISKQNSISYDHNTEIRVIKLNKNGKEILKLCNVIATKDNGVEALNIKISPNPVVSEIRVEILDIFEEASTFELSLFDNNGRLVRKVDEFQKSYSLLAEDLTSGIYFCAITDKKNQKTITKKIIIM